VLILMRERASVVVAAYPSLSAASTVDGLRFEDTFFRVGGVRCVRRRRLRTTGLGKCDEHGGKDDQVSCPHERFGAASEPGGSVDLLGCFDHWCATIEQVHTWLLLAELDPGVGASS